MAAAAPCSTKAERPVADGHPAGDVDAALASSAHVLTEMFTTQRIEHAFLEPEAALRCPKHRVRGCSRRARRLGGPSSARLAARRCARGGAGDAGPDRRSVRRQGGPRRAGTRPRCSRGTPGGRSCSGCHAPRACASTPSATLAMTYTVGCAADGTLTAVRARIVGDTGAYASVGAKVLERAAGHACGAYRYRRSTSSRGRSTRTTRRAAQWRFRRPAGDVRDGRHARPPRRTSGGWTAGRSAGATPSSRATAARPGSGWAPVSDSRQRCWPCVTPTATPGSPGSVAG